ncbi:MAG: hypothetical protein V7L31_19790 [Nostoc sp.]|uniref:hypothetical protein n=1 Tax=Nostoc sp. TaxID=1180 RepID=UPI002FF28670
MKTINHKDAINRRQDERLIVKTAIYHVSCLNLITKSAGGYPGYPSCWDRIPADFR